MLMKSPAIAEELKYIEQSVKEEIPYENTGKLIRSKIGLLVLKACGIEPDKKHFDILISGELIHCASLMHDDVVDDDSMRRGESSFKSIYGDKASVIFGDKLLTIAIDRILNLGSVEVIRNYNSAIYNMCEGEGLQNAYLGKIPDLETYIRKTGLKTASLFSAIIKNLFLISEIKIPEEILSFVNDFGIAFQLSNDLEDVLNSKTDIKRGIYTLPVIFSCGVDITDESIEKTVCLIDNYVRRAVESLSTLDETQYKAELAGMIECLKK